MNGMRSDGGWEMRPGGMLVQRRFSDSNNIQTFNIKLRVKYASSYHHIFISPQATFGELKKKLSEVTGLHPEDQKVMFKDKERESKTFLDVAKVKDGSKLVLIDDVASREKRFLELRRRARVHKDANSLAQITLEVDNLQLQVKGFESVACRGGKLAENEVENMIEMLMSKLIQLDGIVADGELKIQRRMQVRRVQKHIETLDMLNLKFSKPRGEIIENKVDDLHRRRENPNFGKPALKAQNPNCATIKPVYERPLVKCSKSVVVTTKWETFE